MSKRSSEKSNKSSPPIRCNVTGDDRWGRRRLAYPIESHREGFYVVLNYTAEPTVPRSKSNASLTSPMP